MSSGLQAAIRGHVFHRGDPGFEGAAHVFNPRFDHVPPTAVARPVDGLDVRDAVRYTVAHHTPVRARSGGHSYAGYSTLASGVVLDLRKLNSVNLDKTAGTATVGAGAQLIDIYSALASHGVTVPGGTCPSMGIAGVTLGGGFGLASRHLGLTIDSLLAVRIVTADGNLGTVNHQTDADLLWALKGGGGGNFGVVAEFTFKTHAIPASATYFEVHWPWSSAAAAIDAWQSWAPHTDERATSILHLNSGPSPAIIANGQYLRSSGDVPGPMHPLLSVSGASLHTNVEHPHMQIQLLLAGCPGHTLAGCHTAGGAPLFCIQYYGNGATTAWISQAHTKMQPFVSGRAYQNYIDPTLAHWEQAYYDQNLSRLKATRQRVAPDHYFNFPQAIGR
jgi:FAD/FMN-containing dehydrogenase